MGCSARMFEGVSVNQKTVATVGVGARCGRQVHDMRPMRRSVVRRSYPINSLRDWADVNNSLHGWIVLPLAESRITLAGYGAISRNIPGRLCVNPHSRDYSSQTKHWAGYFTVIATPYSRWKYAAKSTTPIGPRARGQQDSISALLKSALFLSLSLPWAGAI